MKALIFSSYTNAYAIYIGVKSYGFETATVDSHPTFLIPSKAGEKKADWLFFTEEASLRRALLGEIQGDYLPRKFPLNLLDDKWALVEWLKGIKGVVKGLKQWALVDHNQATFPCLLKAKHSWAGTVKLPRGWVCRSAEELEYRLNEFNSNNFDKKNFFIQEWLGDSQCRVISVCGFHDVENSHRNLVAVVERIAAHSEGLSCSAAIETVCDEWDLNKKASAILDALNFTGPYEMEFLVTGGNALVLELNPRFWMQHAIFLKNGNGLIKRYLSLDNDHDHKQREINNVIWIDGLHIIISLLLFKVSFLLFVLAQFLKKNVKVIIWPSLPVALGVVARLGFRKLQRKFFA
jgi:hypothetical protein